MTVRKDVGLLEQNVWNGCMEPVKIEKNVPSVIPKLKDHVLHEELLDQKKFRPVDPYVISKISKRVFSFVDNFRF